MSPSRFGALHWPDTELWTRDLDRSAKRPWLSELADLTGYAINDLEAATFRFLQFELGAQNAGIAPLVLVLGVFHRERYHHGLQYCPLCLSESLGVYRRDWRLAVSLICERHDTALRDDCPWCHAPVIPHRTNRNALNVCSRCNRPLAKDELPKHDLMPSVIGLQKQFSARMLSRSAGCRDAVLALRALLSVLSTQSIEDRVRDAFGLSPAIRLEPREAVFERMRRTDRITLLDTAAAWYADWPQRFLVGAKAAGLTQRHFARRDVGLSLSGQLDSLPERQRAERRPSLPLVHTRALRRLARRDAFAYRVKRAERLQDLSD